MSCLEARKSFPQLVVHFLQEKLDILHGAMPSLIAHFKLTRSVTKWAIQENVSFDPKVIIARDLELERYILHQATAMPINQRRATQTVQNHQPKKIVHRRDTVAVTLKNVTSIPFGARGRKRGTSNLIFIGTNPDPDGHQTKNVPIQSETNTPKTYAARSVASAARSVARDSIAPAIPVTSTPLASKSRHEIQPIPFDLSSDLSTTIDMDSLDMSVMGRLAYSSSDE